jgi:hypothetical protein
VNAQALHAALLLAFLSLVVAPELAHAQEAGPQSTGVEAASSVPPVRAATLDEAEVPPHRATTQDVANRSLRAPRAEVVSGALITASAPFMGVLIAILAGPGFFECGFFSDPDPACEARRDRERDQARRMALGISVPWGLVGIGLMAHGGHRLREIRVARRALAFTPSYDFARRTVGLQLRF